MAATFPATPSNGDTATVGGRTYTYNSTDGVWDRTGSSPDTVSTANLTITDTLTASTADVTTLTASTADVTTLEFADASTQTTAGASTGKAIAMSIVFG